MWEPQIADELADLRIATDTGGTFTDRVHPDAGQLRVLKLRSKPGNPAEAVVESLGRIGELHQFELVMARRSVRKMQCLSERVFGLLREPKESELEALASRIMASGIESLAISTLFSFLRPQSELHVGAALLGLGLPILNVASHSSRSDRQKSAPCGPGAGSSATPGRVTAQSPGRSDTKKLEGKSSQ